jgi:hypothetical protein
MAWIQVKVKVGKDTYDARLEDDVLEMAYVEVGDSIKVNNKDVKVLDSQPILRGEFIRLNLAGASDQDKGEKSDDKSIEG